MTRQYKIIGIAFTCVALSFSHAMLADMPSTGSFPDTAALLVVNQSISVQTAVGIALKNSPSIAARKAILGVTAARVGMAKAMGRVQASTTSFINTGDMPMVFRGPENVQPQSLSLTSDSSRLNQSVMAMYPIYTGGRIKGQVDSAQAIHDASTHEVTISELDVAAAVKSAYYRTVLAQRFVEAYQSRVTESQERVRIAEVAFDAGRIAKYDLLRNRTELADSQQQLNNAQADVEMAFIELRDMMGISQTSQLTLTDQLAVLPAGLALDDLQATAIKQRPEIEAARARIRSTQSGIKVVKSAFQPQVYATVMGEYSVSKSSDMSNGTDKGYLIGVTASIPLLDGGSRKASISEAKAMLQQMQADEQEAVQSVTKSVAIAYTRLNAASKNVILAEVAIEQSEEDYRVIRMRYEAAKATNAEVLDALASFTKAQTNYLESLYTQNIAGVELTRAIGQR